MAYSTVRRFKNGYINITATVWATAWSIKKREGYDEVSYQDVALELACQGVDVCNHKIGPGAEKNMMSEAQIKRALPKLFTHIDGGYYKVQGL